MERFLPGVTRDSVIQLLKSWGYVVEERHLSIDELMEAGRNGKLQEAFWNRDSSCHFPNRQIKL